MSKTQPDDFEPELKRLQPAEPPKQFLDRLATTLPGHQATRPLRPGSRPSIERYATLFQWWLAPVGIAVCIFLALWFLRPSSLGTRPGPLPVAESTVPSLIADKVEIDRQLVASFDTVARLPDGKPVRFRCREWVDKVVLQDSGKGVVVEQKAPRLEVIPIGFETY